MSTNLLNIDINECASQPKPLCLDRQHNKLNIYAILPKPFVDILKEYSTVYSIPTPYLLVGLLSAVSIAIGKSVVVRFKRNQTTYANIYTIIVGQPNSNKTQPLRFMLAPIEEYDRELYEIYRAGVTEYNSKGKDEKVSFPTKQQIVVKDSTQEAITEAMLHNTRGILVFVDEIPGFFGNLNRYNNGSDIERILECWSNVALKVDRRGGEMIRVDAPFLTIVGGAQPEAIAKVFRSVGLNNGTVDRFDFAIPLNQGPAEWVEQDIDEETYLKYQIIIKKLLQLPLLMENGELSPLELKLSDETRKRIMQWRNGEHLMELKEHGSTPLAAAYGKFDIKLLKYCIIIEMLKYSVGLSDGTEVSIETVESAIELTKYFKLEMSKLHKMVYSNDLTDLLTESQYKTYKTLSYEFRTQDAINIGATYGISKRSINRFLNQDNYFKKVQHGIYRKNIDTDMN